jgi:hypothetical protein
VSRNVFFDLTREFNAEGAVAALGAGQAVVYYRVAIMSKDGDWIVRETPAACERILTVLAEHGARYRPGAPLDVRWLAGGWSSHVEFQDAARRRVRCDFFSRPPRVPRAAVARLFEHATDPLLVVDVESLILMKQTQRAKDYAVLGELASRLPPEREIELTTDPDRVLALAPAYGAGSGRPAVRAAMREDRRAVVVELALEADRLQAADRRRLDAYAAAARPFLEAFARLSGEERTLPDGHAAVCQLAAGLLPPTIPGEVPPDADDQ